MPWITLKSTSGPDSIFHALFGKKQGEILVCNEVENYRGILATKSATIFPLNIPLAAPTLETIATTLNLTIHLFKRETNHLVRDRSFNETGVGSTTANIYFNESSKNYEAVEEVYEASGLKSTLHGNIYQLKLLMLFLYRGHKEGYNFKLATEMDDAEKFDDLVFEYHKTDDLQPKYFFLQAKHKQDHIKTVTTNDLTDTSDGEFSLTKYFSSYNKIKRKILSNGGNLEAFSLCLCTNIALNQAIQSKFDLILTPEPLLDTHPSGKRYRLKKNAVLNKDIYDHLRENTEGYKLAHTLVQSILKGKEAKSNVTLKTPLFKEHHANLANANIIVQGKFTQNFINGPVNVPIWVNKFRTLLIAEARKELKDNASPEIDILKKLAGQMKAGTTFGVKDKNPIFDLEVEITDVQIEDFFNHFVLAVEQSDEVELGKIIAKELGEEFNLIDSGLIYADFEKKMLDWMKDKKGTFLTHQSAENFRKEIKSKLSSLILVGPTLDYQSKLDALGLNFSPSAEITTFLEAGNQNAMIYSASRNVLLGSMQIHQTLKTSPIYQTQDSYIFISLRKAIRIKETIIEAFKSRKLLVLICNRVPTEEEVTQLIQPLLAETTNPARKIIFVSTHSQDLRDVIHTQKLPLFPVSVNFFSLTIPSQQALRQWPVIFQGQIPPTSLDQTPPTSLGQIAENLAELMDEEILSELIFSKNKEKIIQIGEEIPLSKASQYYVQRRLSYTTEQIDEKFLQQNTTDIFAISGIEAADLQKIVVGKNVRNFTEQDINEENPSSYIILTRDKESDQFETLCAQHPTVHLLARENGAWIWKSTQGNLTSLRPYMIKSKELGFTKGMTILAAEPGMGKSTMTMQLAHRLQKDPTLWVIYINLSTIESQLNAIDGIDDTDEAIAKFLLPNASYLEQKMLESRLHEKGRVSLFLDGLDEINVSAQINLILLLSALQAKQVHQVVVSMRNNIAEVLEDTLCVFSASLVPFNREDRLAFFEKFWKKTLGLTEIDRSKVETFADKLIAIFDATTNSTGQDFIGIPLQAELLATAFSKAFEEFHKEEISEPQLPLALDLDELYQRFIATKYEIFKAKLKLGENKENLEAMFNLTTKHLDKTHQLFAFNLLFPTANLTKNNIMTIRGDALVKAVGLIHSINENPDFVHRTFAEYFAAQFLVHQLMKYTISKSYKIFLERNIFKVRHQMVRLFMEQYINKVANSSLSEIWKAIKNNNLLPPSQGSTKVLLENSTLAVAPLSYQVAKDQLGNKFREEKQEAINEIIGLCNAILSINATEDEPFIDPFEDPFTLLNKILTSGRRKPEREAVHSRLKDIFWYYIQVHQRLGRLFDNQRIQAFKKIRDRKQSIGVDLARGVLQTQAVIKKIYKDMEENNTFSPSINLLEEIFAKNANINQREVHKARDWLTNIGVQLVKTFNILTPKMAPLFIKVASDLLERSPTTLGKYLYSLENNLLNPLLNNINKDTKLDHSIFIDMYHKIMSFHEQYFHGTWALTPEGMRNLLKLIKGRLETSVDATTLSTCVSLLYLFNKVGIHLICTETAILLVDPNSEAEYSLPLNHAVHVWDLIRFKADGSHSKETFLKECVKKARLINSQYQLPPTVKTLKRTASGTLLSF